MNAKDMPMSPTEELCNFMRPLRPTIILIDEARDIGIHSVTSEAITKRGLGLRYNILRDIWEPPPGLPAVTPCWKLPWETRHHLSPLNWIKS